MHQVDEAQTEFQRQLYQYLRLFGCIKVIIKNQDDHIQIWGPELFSALHPRGQGKLYSSIKLNLTNNQQLDKCNKLVYIPTSYDGYIHDKPTHNYVAQQKYKQN